MITDLKARSALKPTVKVADFSLDVITDLKARSALKQITVVIHDTIIK